MKTKTLNRAHALLDEREEVSKQLERRRKKNLKEARAILRYIPKHGINSDTIVERIEDILKEYIEDLRYEPKG
jgi:hypothetical protein